MCTVSYVPLAGNRFVLTSNRDESPSRSPQSISQEDTLLYPKDTKGGTWICASNQNRLVCLLNGAFIKHKRTPPYPKSRGIIVKDVFRYDSIVDFHTHYDLTGIEPFTMVVWEQGKLYQFRRDEEQSYLTPLHPQSCYIWSSATLYDAVTKRKRQTWFDQWQQQKVLTPESILNLHQTGGDGDVKNDYIMNRDNIVRTVSITQVILKNEALEMTYHDLLGGKTSSENITLR